MTMVVTKVDAQIEYVDCVVVDSETTSDTASDTKGSRSKEESAAHTHSAQVHFAAPPIPLVCLHGIGGDHNSFEAQWTGLANPRRVLAWNAPGYRGSVPLDTLNFESLADRFIRWLDELQLTVVHVLGQSIGGMLAQEIALRYPDRVAGLVLIATTSAFGGRDDTFKKKFLEARMTPLDRGTSMAELANRFVPEIVGDMASKQAVDAAIQSMSGVPEATYRQIMGCLVDFNRRKEWVTMVHPICLLAGSEDTNAPANTMKKMADALKEQKPDDPVTVEYHCIEGAGHLVNLEQPAICNSIIDRFLTKIEN